MEKDEFDQPKNKRPEFLTVICIMTFVGSAWGILSGLGTLAFSDQLLDNMVQQAEMQEQLTEQIGGTFGKILSMMSSINQDMIDNFVPLTIGSVISCIICLVGALLMWRLRKIGFYPYLIGELGLPIFNIVLIGGVMAYIGLFFPILFVIFYAIHLKHMK
ncbi:MAG: hypothetical protein MRY83_16355 [Flavobacteriales bacterium]|nr:hypothetical protein [Flavobacteriales bacterium]